MIKKTTQKKKKKNREKKKKEKKKKEKTNEMKEKSRRKRRRSRRRRRYRGAFEQSLLHGQRRHALFRVQSSECRGCEKTAARQSGALTMRQCHCSLDVGAEGPVGRACGADLEVGMSFLLVGQHCKDASVKRLPKGRSCSQARASGLSV